MKLNDGLRNILKEDLLLYLDCFIKMMLLSLLTLKQINLTQLALGFKSDTAVKSRYRHLQRFFKKVNVDYDAIMIF